MTYIESWFFTLISIIAVVVALPDTTPLWVLVILGLLIRAFWSYISEKGY